MNPSAKIFVADHRGMVGSAIVRRLQAGGFSNVNGRIVFDTSKPDGTPRELLDVSRLAALGWRASTGLREGIARSYADCAGKENSDG